MRPGGRLGGVWVLRCESYRILLDFVGRSMNCDNARPATIML